MDQHSFLALDLTQHFDCYPRIETERLILRELQLDDADAIFEYGKDPDVVAYMPWAQHKTVEDARAFLEICSTAFEARERIPLGIHSREHNRIIGSCDFHLISLENHSVEIGYALNRKYWGKGYMTETLIAMIAFAFRDLGMHRVAANCDERNIASYRVMEKAGMQYEGTSKECLIRNGEYASLRRYAIINSAALSQFTS